MSETIKDCRCCVYERTKTPHVSPEKFKFFCKFGKNIEEIKNVKKTCVEYLPYDNPPKLQELYMGQTICFYCLSHLHKQDLEKAYDCKVEFIDKNGQSQGQCNCWSRVHGIRS